MKSDSHGQRQGKAYALLFTLENKLRVGMHNVLVAGYGTGYRISSLFPQFSYTLNGRTSQYDIRAFVARRKRVEKEHNLQAGFEYPAFWYLDFSMLTILIDQFWDQHFSQLFRSTKVRNELVQRLKLLFTVRNSIAHNRFISEQDFADIQGTLVTLGGYLKPEFVANYEALALNKPDQIRTATQELLVCLIELLKRKRIVGTEILMKIKSSMSALAQFRTLPKSLMAAIDEILLLIEEYNRVLPRKPGRGADIDRYLEEVELISRIETVILRVKAS